MEETTHTEQGNKKEWPSSLHKLLCLGLGFAVTIFLTSELFHGASSAISVFGLFFAIIASYNCGPRFGCVFCRKSFS